LKMLTYAAEVVAGDGCGDGGGVYVWGHEVYLEIRSEIRQRREFVRISYLGSGRWKSQ